ncbi:MAG: hypothetical protein JNL58_15815 [Planctomyces sp.]|nr:hypothetical protein [Planctomyces sp.]
MVTMGYSNLGNGIYGLEAEADFEAWVDPLDDPWDFRYGLTIHDTNSFEWARNSGSFSLNPGSQTTWSSDTFNGPSTSSSGVYNAVAGIEGRYTGAGEYDLLEFEAANVTIP